MRVSKLVLLFVALVDFLGISFLTSCFWATVLLLREVCSSSTSMVFFSCTFFIFSFFCLSCRCFCFSLDGSAVAGPFYIGAFKKNVVIAGCLTSLGNGGRGDPSPLSDSILISIAFGSLCLCGWVIFSLETSISYSLRPCASCCSFVCDGDSVGIQLSGPTKWTTLDLEASWFLRTTLHRW